MSESSGDRSTNPALLFDIDGTLTLPRQPLPPEMGEALQKLSLPFHVAAGSDLAIVEPQFLKPLWSFGFRKDIEAFVSNAATHFHCAFSDEYRIERVSDFDFARHLGKKHQADLMKVLTETLTLEEFRLPAPIRVIGDQITLRGSMINLSPIGRPKGDVTDEVYKNRTEFEKFDTATGYRKKMRLLLNEKLAHLIKAKGLRIAIGGKTGFDILIDGFDKTLAVRTLLRMGYSKIVFIGDALFENGNDEVIMTFINGWRETTPCPLSAVAVKDWRDTLHVLHNRGWIKS